MMIPIKSIHESVPFKHSLVMVYYIATYAKYISIGRVNIGE